MRIDDPLMYVWLHFGHSVWLICFTLWLSVHITVSNTQTMLQYHSNQFFLYFSITNNFHFFLHTHTVMFMCEHFMLANICKYLLFMSMCVRVRMPFWNVVKLFGDKVIIKSLDFTSVHQTKIKQQPQKRYQRNWRWFSKKKKLYKMLWSIDGSRK